MTPPQAPMPTSDLVPSWVTPDLLAYADLSELTPADPLAHAKAEQLSAALDACVAAYPAPARSSRESRPNSLCHTLEAAQLDTAQLRLLAAAEACFPGVSFVAYKYPPKLRCPVRP